MTVNHVVSLEGATISIQAAIITAILAAVMFGSKPILKKKISPIVLIVVSACLGLVVYGI